MKNQLNLVAVLAAFFFSSSALWAAQSYPMSCRGGDGTLGYAPYKAMFYFSKSSGPARNGLQPGQCSWMDRAIGPNEPTCLEQNGVNDVAWIFPAKRAQSYFTSANGSWLRGMLDASHYQTFQVYNPGTSGCFIVTKVGQ